VGRGAIHVEAFSNIFFFGTGQRGAQTDNRMGVPQYYE